ncbi:MAG TPA: alpha-L-fucosidase [Capsulimonadaceae bacterium]|jgi:alpha-L-fucosidase
MTFKNAEIDTRLNRWNTVNGIATAQSAVTHADEDAVALGPIATRIEQTVQVDADTSYVVTAWVRSGSGSEQVCVGVRCGDGGVRETASALVTFNQVRLPFCTTKGETEVVVYVVKTGGDGIAYASELSIECVGKGERDRTGTYNSILQLPARNPVSDLGVMQQSNDQLQWLHDAKFGMFIHWGLYAGPAKGEWHQHTSSVPTDEYARLATPESGDEYFAADQFDPAQWAEVAKAAGMRWMCLTARHHDGYSLFDNPHPNAFTSVQSHNRDFIAEYVQATRESGLKVGLYFSPLSWRYPGYYDVTGTDCQPNVFGYITSPDHKENARLWKEENYVAVHKLVTGYGPIDYMYWDGGWLAQQDLDADAAYFHEPGLHLDPNNEWQIDDKYIDRDEAGKGLGIMGMTRKHQPQLVCNIRYGWIGDFDDEEGNAAIFGPIRSDRLIEKCMTTQKSGWGYIAQQVESNKILTRDEIIEHLANAIVRNMFVLLNVGPDRHGRIPPNIEATLRQVGDWLARTSDAVYGTHGGPWQPCDGQYGFCFNSNTVFIHLFNNFAGTTFTVPPIGQLSPTRAYDVFSGQTLDMTLNADRTVTITEIDRETNPVDSIVAIQFDVDVMTFALSTKAN